MRDGAGGKARVSNGYACWLGTLWVTLPVLAIMFGGWIVPPLLVLRFSPHTAPFGTVGAIIVVVVWVLLPFVGAWTWWSVNVPRWRIWALKRTTDWPSLQVEAISVGLIWDETSLLGQICSRTEIWPPSRRQRETELLARHGLPPRGRYRCTHATDL